MRFTLKLVCAVVCAGAPWAMAQDAPGTAQELARVSRELQETRAELADSRKEIEELRQGLEGLRSQMLANQQGNQPANQELTAAVANPVSSSTAPTVAAADQDVSFLAAKVAELHQDKVESASKYPVKISGLLLFNSYWNNGNLDIQDLPNLAFPKFPGAAPAGIGATLRQTVLGVEVTGPRIFGARSYGDAEVDFAGGSPTTSFGTTNGLLRLRTAKLSLDWKDATLKIGQDSLFFSPLSPTSYATILEPALSWSGNLWVWTPQVEIERRVSVGGNSAFVLQGGVLDPLTEETPPLEGREPMAGESTRAPAIAGRVAFDHSALTGASETRFPFTVGFGGYRANQQYGALPTVASWTVNTDIKAGFGSYVEISGEFYTGQAVGGLGGGIWTSVAYPEATQPYTAIEPLRSAGGWGQLKIMPSTHFEINGAFGQDENLSQSLKVFPVAFSAAGFPAMQKNRTEFVNFIYKPNSALLLALEYRHLFTATMNSAGASGDQVNLAAGVHF
jgi:hypothetical protein